MAFSTKLGSTQRGGLLWIETFPPKIPKVFRIRGDNTFNGFPT
jgi:hypothetical protein